MLAKQSIKIAICNLPYCGFFNKKLFNIYIFKKYVKSFQKKN